MTVTLCEFRQTAALLSAVGQSLKSAEVQSYQSSFVVWSSNIFLHISSSTGIGAMVTEQFETAFLLLLLTFVTVHWTV